MNYSYTAIKVIPAALSEAHLYRLEVISTVESIAELQAARCRGINWPLFGSYTSLPNLTDCGGFVGLGTLTPESTSSVATTMYISGAPNLTEASVKNLVNKVAVANGGWKMYMSSAQRAMLTDDEIDAAMTKG